MCESSQKWIRIFSIPEHVKHKKGFTIYKVVSMLYPENCPDAVIKITVWKRFNEFKFLHKEIKTLNAFKNSKTKYPLVPKSTFFKRFDDTIIADRIDFIVSFLDYIALSTDIFTSNTVVKFFETSHTPSNMLNSSINSIRAELHLAGEPEYSPFYSVSSEDDNNFSDTDSISTLSSLSPSSHHDLITDYTHQNNLTKSATTEDVPSLSFRANKSTSLTSLSSSTINVTFLDPILEYNDSQIMSENNADAFYIYQAGECIRNAVDLENNLNYEHAFQEYKRGIDILLTHVKDDKNYERREMVRFKTARYLLRAEKIYNVHLDPEVQNAQNSTKDDESVAESIKPMSELAKYKVIRVLDAGMIAIYSVTQETFYVKVLQKTAQFSTNELILPDSVPFMVKLRKFYNCENVVVLILEYASALKLKDYLKTNQRHANLSTSPVNISDSSSEGSYVDLINEYRSLTKDKLEVHQMKSELQEATHGQSKSLEFLRQDAIKSGINRKCSVVSFFSDLEIENIHISIDVITKWCAQLLLALEKLHYLGIICRDLRMDHILIDENQDVLLTYKSHISDRRIFLDRFLVAPEFRSINKVTKSVDWWSYGVLLYELLAGISLEKVHTEGITSYTRLKIPNHVTPEGKSLIKQLLVFEGSQRLGAGPNGTEDIKSHPFFSNISWKSLSRRVNKF